MPPRSSLPGAFSALQQGSGGRNGTSFHGCLRNLYINGRLQDLGAGLGPAGGAAGAAASAGSGSGAGQSPPTGAQWLGQGMEAGCQPCQQGACAQGDCHPTGHSGFTCTCHPGWTGAGCDQQLSQPCSGNK